MSTRSLRQNLHDCTCDGIAATPIVYLVQPGNFILAALLVERFQLPPDLYGLIASLPFWGNFAQAFLVPVLNQAFSAQTVSVAASTLQAVCWAALAGALSFLPVNQPGVSGPWFLTLFIFSAAITALTGVSWTSWVQEWVPLRLRGKYFGRRNRSLQITQLAFLFFSGWLLDRLTGSILAFQCVLGGAVLLRLGSVIFQRKIQAAPPVEIQPSTKLPWREQARTLLATPAFLWLVAYGAAWGFATSCFGPFYSVFIYKELGFSVQAVSLLMILSSAGAAISYPAWGALADRFGNKPVMLFCMIAWQLQNFLWCLLTPANSWLLYGMWTFGGIMGAGFVLSLFNLQLKVIPPRAKTLAISANLAITSLITAIGPILGGLVLNHFLTAGVSAIDVYHRTFLVLPVLALLACLLLARVHERAAGSLSSVAGAMRNIRTLGGVFGLGFLVGYVFVKPAKKR